MPLGIYISVPFCRTKCTFCNFASGVFSRELFDRYVMQVTAEIARADALANSFGGDLEHFVDSIYLGGGTPSVLAPDQLASLFRSVRDNFNVSADAEITVECAPSTLSPEIIGSLVACGVNRVSLGVQSFVDQESRAVGRLHTREITLQDIAHLRASGIHDIGIDLIAGLPHQTAASWRYSVEETLATEVPHVSVYMLEVDDDSRLGRELIAGGTRYHAHHVPDDDLTADLYLAACEVLNSGGVRQYEISNFARGEMRDRLPLHASRHNLKYWLRHSYLGFGVDAHSMLSAPQRGEPHAAIRFATTDDFDKLLAGAPHSRIEVDERAAIEEAWFLGLRLNRGVELLQVHEEFGIDAVERYREPITELVESGLLDVEDGFVRLTDRGRLLSNEVFGRFIESRSEAADATDKGPKITIV
jgi:oxygen-independent coproporphyrinogen III oxidase